ncbi:hypothetical protein Cpir12675_006421, partial [Ceratocystis pirilliformis]
QKYQGSLYKNKNKKQRLNNSQDIATPSRNTKNTEMAAVQSHPVPEHLRQYQAPESLKCTPLAPAPRTVSINAPVNVFDFFVGQATPTASTVSRDNELVPFQGPDEDDDNDTLLAERTDAAAPLKVPPPVPAPPVESFETPAPKSYKPSKHREPSSKTDKKRKRPHVDSIDTGIANTPTLHTGLSVNMGRLMRSAMPPSPEYSGGDTNGHSPSSPLKKSKQHTGILEALWGTSKSKSKSKSASSSPKPKKTRSSSKSKSKESSSKKTSSSHRHRHHQKTAAKLIEYNKDLEKKSDKGTGGEGQMVLYNNSRAKSFLGIVEDSENERGYSIHKALKRYHREFNKEKSSSNRVLEDKELFKMLRLRRNDRGEIVVFVPDEE